MIMNIDYEAIRLLIKRDNVVGHIYNKICSNNPNLSAKECFDELYDKYITHDTYISYDYKLCKEEITEAKIKKANLAKDIKIVNYYIAGRGPIEQNMSLSIVLDYFIKRINLVDNSYLSLGVLLDLNGTRKPIELLVDNGINIFASYGYRDSNIKIQAIVEPIIYELNGVLSEIKARKQIVA